MADGPILIKGDLASLTIEALHEEVMAQFDANLQLNCDEEGLVLEAALQEVGHEVEYCSLYGLLTEDHSTLQAIIAGQRTDELIRPVERYTVDPDSGTITYSTGISYEQGQCSPALECYETIQYRYDSHTELGTLTEASLAKYLDLVQEFVTNHPVPVAEQLPYTWE